MKPPSDYYVYALKRDGQIFYIGKGRGDRWLHHERDARNGVQNHRCNLIRAACNAGIAVTRIKLYEDLTEANANLIEIYLIASLGRHPHGPLINQTDGGDGVRGLKRSLESRAKMAAAKIGRKLSPESIAKRTASGNGKFKSPEHRAKVSAALMNHEVSFETRAKISTANTGLKRSVEVRTKISAALSGRLTTPEHRAKLSAAQTGKIYTSEARANMSAARKAYLARCH